MMNQSSPSPPKRSSSSGASAMFRKERYKFSVLFAILLLAFWTMFAGSVSLKWISADVSFFSDDIDFPVLDDLDVLEVEDRKMLVNRMWNFYRHRNRARLPRFWLEAFKAAYEDMTSDVPGVRDVAVSEIAKMSIHSINVDPLPSQSTGFKLMGRRRMKLAAES